MYKIAVVGDRDSVLGFQALGLSVFPVETAEEARRVIHATAKEAYAIIYLTEQLGTQLKDLLAQYEKDGTRSNSNSRKRRVAGNRDGKDNRNGRTGRGCGHSGIRFLRQERRGTAMAAGKVHGRKEGKKSNEQW